MTFALPFLLALLVGAIGITRQAWRDEHATWWAATIPLSDLGDLLSRMDIVVAPYYLFMRVWIAVAGDSVVALRFPSLIAMATAAGLTAVAGARLYHPWVGLTAGSLFAVVPSVSRYAEEARPYAFAICFAVATVLALLARRWVLLAVFVTLTGLAHLVALTILLAHLPLLPRLGASANGGAISWRFPGRATPRTGDLSERAAIAPGRAIPHSGDLSERAAIAPGPAAAPAGDPSEHAAGAAAPHASDPSERAAIAPGRAAAPAGDPSGHVTIAAAPEAVGAGDEVGGTLTGVARAGDWGRWAAAVGVALALLAPLAVLGLRQSGQVEWIDAGWASLATLPANVARSAAVAGVLGALAVLAVLAGRVDRRWALLVVWVVAPPLVVFAAAPTFFYYRYLLFTLPAWTVLAALGAHLAVRELSRRRQLVVAVALCAAVLALGARDHVAVRRSPLAGDQDYQGAAAYLVAHMSAGDSVYFSGYPDKRERFGFAYEMRAVPAPALCTELASCASRVWQVSNGPGPVPTGFIELDAQAFQGIQLRLLKRG